MKWLNIASTVLIWLCFRSLGIKCRKDSGKEKEILGGSWQDFAAVMC